MDHLLDFLTAQRDRPIGTVVYVGAGDGLAFDVERYAALAPQRLVLVEGDPETAAELERRVGHLPFVAVRAVALAPHAGALPWHRYNLGMLNGAVDAMPLLPYYPRLRAVEQRDLQAVTLADLLAEVGPGSPTHLNVLVMDVPGQEDALLAAVPEERLITIDTIILRGCREALPPYQASADAARRRLQRHSFRKKFIDDHAEPLWPLTLMRFDPVRHRLVQFERELAAAREAQQQRDARIAELEAAQANLQAQARNADRRTTEHLQQVQQLTRASEADNALLGERDAQLAEKVLRCQALEAALRDQAEATQLLQAQLASAHTAHAAEIQRMNEASVQRITQLEEQLRDQRTAPTPPAPVAPDEPARLAMQRRRQDAEQRLAAAQRRVAQLEQQVLRLESDQSRHTMRQQLLQDELHRAEGQIDLIKGLLLGEAGL